MRGESLLQTTEKGPQGTPFEGGRFVVVLNFPQDYPTTIPSVAFKTKIYHPGVRQRPSQDGLYDYEARSI